MSLINKSWQRVGFCMYRGSKQKALKIGVQIIKKYIYSKQLNYCFLLWSFYPIYLLKLLTSIWILFKKKIVLLKCKRLYLPISVRVCCAFESNVVDVYKCGSVGCVEWHMITSIIQLTTSESGEALKCLRFGASPHLFIFFYNVLRGQSAEKILDMESTFLKLFYGNTKII